MFSSSCRRPGALLLIMVVALTARTVNAGDIPGIPPALLPQIGRDFALTFSNDFLGRGGSVDDFRTQQLNVVAAFSDHWFLVVDHSILTLSEPPAPGRVDQLSASLGYRLIDTHNPNGSDTLAIGGGIRSAGDFAGERIQNGFHRLIGSDIESLPYVETDTTDLTFWIDANRYRDFLDHKSWMLGYWLQARSLITADGQWDSAASVAAVFQKGSFNLWLGLRRDWRSGYDVDRVQSATAAAEDDSAIVLGIRFGALVLETVQQLNNDASYGQLSLVSSGFRNSSAGVKEPRGSVEIGFLLPDVQVQLLGKLRTEWLTNDDSAWHDSAFLELRYGEPQYGSDETLFLKTQQIAAGLEWERSLSENTQWVSFYTALGFGWRTEQLEQASSSRASSESVGRGVATAATGLRFNTAALGGGWNYRVHIGLTAWAPFKDADVTLDGEQYSVQQPELALVLGMSFDFSNGN